MEIIKTKIKNSFKKKYLAIILVVIIIILIFFIVFKVKQNNKSKKVVFFENPKSGKEPHKDEPEITAAKYFKTHPSGFEFSFHYWLFVHDWSYKFGQVKHIFSKGKKPEKELGEAVNQCPGVFLAKYKNNLIMTLNVKNEQNPIKLIIPNIPLNKWMDIALTVKNNYVELYFNGKLYLTKVLSNIVLQNENPLHTSVNKGFSGLLSNLTYYPYSLSPKEVLSNHNNGLSKHNNILNIEDIIANKQPKIDIPKNNIPKNNIPICRNIE